MEGGEKEKTGEVQKISEKVDVLDLEKETKENEEMNSYSQSPINRNVQDEGEYEDDQEGEEEGEEEIFDLDEENSNDGGGSDWNDENQKVDEQQGNILDTSTSSKVSASSTISARLSRSATPLRLSEEEEQEEQEVNKIKEEKQYLVFTSSGRPIYTLLGEADNFLNIMGAVQAILSLSQKLLSDSGNNREEDLGNAIQSIQKGNRKIVFLNKAPIYLFVVSSRQEPIVFLKLQLEYLYHQIIFLVTSQITTMLKRNPRYDARELLGKTDSVLKSAAEFANPNSPLCGSILTGGVPSLPMSYDDRQDISKKLKNATEDVPDLLFAILLVSHRVLTVIQTKDYNYQLNPTDFIVLINYIESVKGSLKSEHIGPDADLSHTFPICLPTIADKSYLHASCSYLDEPADLMLLLISTLPSPVHFKEAKAKLTSALAGNHPRGKNQRPKTYLAQVLKDAQRAKRVLDSFNEDSFAFHFLYKYKQNPYSINTNQLNTDYGMVESRSEDGSNSGHELRDNDNTNSNKGKKTLEANTGNSNNNEKSGNRNNNNSSRNKKAKKVNTALTAITQCISSAFFFPYLDSYSRQRIWHEYTLGSLRMRHTFGEEWNSHRISTNYTALEVFDTQPFNQLQYTITDNECVVCTHGVGFELYATFAPTVTVPELFDNLAILHRNLQAEEHYLFETRHNSF